MVNRTRRPDVTNQPVDPDEALRLIEEGDYHFAPRELKAAALKYKAAKSLPADSDAYLEARAAWAEYCYAEG